MNWTVAPNCLRLTQVLLLTILCLHVATARAAETTVTDDSTEAAAKQSITNSSFVKMVWENIVVRTVHGAIAMIGIVVFIVFSVTVIVLLPFATNTIHILISSSTALRIFIVFALAGAVGGFHYFRYHYPAPKKTTSDSKGRHQRRCAKDSDRNDPGFDLHPDVTRSEDNDDGSGFMASLEARGGKQHYGGLPRSSSSSAGLGGFPADFLNMFMKSISIFGYIEEPVFHEFSRQLQTRRLLAGEFMFDSEGDRDDQNFYVVIDGQVQIYLTDENAMAAKQGQQLPSASRSFVSDAAGQHQFSGDDSDDGKSSIASEEDEETDDPSSPILLNVIGPGDVLSSLFSILSLFTEGIPLRHDSVHQRQQGLSKYSLGKDAHQQNALHIANVSTYLPSPLPLAAGSQSDKGVAVEDVGNFSGYELPVGTDAFVSSSQPISEANVSEFATPATAPTHLHPNTHAGESQNLRPNVIARATTDTTLAMIPASAFQRVTRLYPKAAAHILQVILTRLQRVTFATLYDYLDLPGELVAIERAISRLARYPLSRELTDSDTLRAIKRIYLHSEIESTEDNPLKSPLLSSRSTFANTGLGGGYPSQLEPSTSLQPSWKITHQGLQRHARRRSLSSASTDDKPQATTTRSRDGDDIEFTVAPNPASRIGSRQQRRHRRAGSDGITKSNIPSKEDIEQLRVEVLDQLCMALGLNPKSIDGRYTPIPIDPTGSTPRSFTAANASVHSGHRSSSHRGPPRTEHLLPLLQSLKDVGHERRGSSSTPPLPLSELPSLVDELDIYHVPNSFSLIEQGQRPDGLFIILDGTVEITHRDSVAEFRHADSERVKSGDVYGQRYDDTAIREMCREMTRLARNDKESSSSDQGSLRMRGQLPTSKRSIELLAHTMGTDSHSIDNSIRDDAARNRTPRSSAATRPYRTRKGDVVGYLPALTDMASLYTARCKSSNGVIVGFVSRWALDRLNERYPILLMTLARRLTSQLPPAILNIDYALEWVQMKASEMVHRQGEMSRAVYVVLTGRLRAFVEKDNNAAIGILAEYGQGQSVGEPNLLLSEPCKFNLHAIRDTELVRIPTALFKALMYTAPHLTFHLSRTLAMRAARSMYQQQALSTTGLLSSKQKSKKEGKAADKEGFGPTNLESGVRSHNRNLKSIAIIPVHEDVPVRRFAGQLEDALVDIAGDVALLDHTAVSRMLGRHAFSRIARLKIVGWIAELEQRCRLLLHVADGGISSPWTRHCVRHSDFVLLVGLGDGDSSVGEYERLLLALKTTARKELVLLHESRSCSTGTTREWLKKRPWVHAHHHIRMPLYGADQDSFDVVDNSSNGQVSVLTRARSLITQSVLEPSRKVLTNGGIERIKTSLEKYYYKLVRDRQLTPATYQGHRSDFARLGRYLCGKSVGLVLSGGGARGIALLGILQAFEEAGIPVDMIGGTSIGAFVSGLYAQTPDSVAIHGLIKAFSRRMSSMWRFLLDVTYPILAYTSGREFNRTIWKVFKGAEIEDLWLPFYCLTANITRSRSEVHTSGLLWRAVRGSMSLGGFVPPLCDENGDMLVDGGYLDNLPVQVMKNQLGANMMFAIDIAAENDTSAVRYGESVSGFWVLLNHLNPFRSYWIPTLSEVQSRLTYASSDKELESAKIADSCVYLRVPPKDVGVLDFGRFDELYRRGYEYGKEWTTKWQQKGLLNQWQLSPATAATAAATLSAMGNNYNNERNGKSIVRFSTISASYSNLPSSGSAANTSHAREGKSEMVSSSSSTSLATSKAPADKSSNASRHRHNIPVLAYNQLGRRNSI